MTTIVKDENGVRIAGKVDFPTKDEWRAAHGVLLDALDDCPRLGTFSENLKQEFRQVAAYIAEHHCK